MRACVDYEPMPEDRAGEIWEWLRDRFGLERHCFEGMRLWQRPGSPSIWIASDCVDVVPGGQDPETVGLLLMRDPPPRGFPSTAFAQRFGMLATKRVVRVDESQAAALLAGEGIPRPEEFDRGVLIVQGPLGAVGRGWIRGDEVRVDISANRRSRLQPVSSDASKSMPAAPLGESPAASLTTSTTACRSSHE